MERRKSARVGQCEPTATQSSPRTQTRRSRRPFPIVRSRTSMTRAVGSIEMEGAGHSVAATRSAVPRSRAVPSIVGHESAPTGRVVAGCGQASVVAIGSASTKVAPIHGRSGLRDRCA